MLTGVISPAAPAIALTGCKLNQVFATLALGIAGYSNIHNVGMCSAMGTPPSDAKPAPQSNDAVDNAPDVANRGDCTDYEKESLGKWYHQICESKPLKCKGNDDKATLKDKIDGFKVAYELELMLRTCALEGHSTAMNK